MNNRPLCPSCTQKPVAVNYVKEGVTHYRRLCDNCLRKGKKFRPPAPAWAKTGYKKKEKCERCGFKAKYPIEQLRVFHVDGSLKNNDWTNLKTVCLNCYPEILKSNLPWKPAPIVPDF